MKKYSICKFAIDAGMILSAAAIAVSLSGGVRWELPGPFRFSVHEYNRAFAVFALLLILRMIFSVQSCSGLANRVNRLIDEVGVAVDRIKPMRCLCLMAGLLVVLLAASPLIRYFQYGDMPDFCIHVEVLHSALRGEMLLDPFNYRMFHVPDMGFDIADPRVCAFADHFKPIVFLFVPIFKVFPSGVTLLIIQALVIASGLFPLYMLARDKLGNEKWALVIAASYCCYPPVVGTAWSYFPSVSSMSFLLWAFWASSRRRHVMMWILLLLTLSAKEMMALPVISFGAYLFIMDKKRVHGALAAGIGLVWLVVCLYWIVPHYTPDGQYAYLDFYADEASSFHGMILGILKDPSRFLLTVFSKPTLYYFMGILMTVAFLPLVGWRVWLFTLPMLAQNVLSSRMYIFPTLPGGLWSAPIVPFTFLAVISGIIYLQKRYSSRLARYALFFLFTASLMGMPAGRHLGRWHNRPMIELSEYLSENVPEGSRVSTNILLAWPQWSGRYRLTYYPFNVIDDDYAVLRLSSDLLAQTNGEMKEDGETEDGAVHAEEKKALVQSMDEYWEKAYVEIYRSIKATGSFVEQTVITARDGSSLVVLKRSDAQ